MRARFSRPASRPSADRLTGERTRLCVSVPIETYMRLALHCEHRDGALSQFVTRAIEAQIVREELDRAASRGRRMNTRDTLDHQRRMLRHLTRQADTLKTSTAELKQAIRPHDPNNPNVMGDVLCPRCRVRYLPLAGTCACQKS
jgi:hypothetical protein